MKYSRHCNSHFCTTFYNEETFLLHILVYIVCMIDISFFLSPSNSSYLFDLKHDKNSAFRKYRVVVKGKSLFCDLLLFQCFLCREESGFMEEILENIRGGGWVLFFLYTLHMSETVLCCYHFCSRITAT